MRRFALVVLMALVAGMLPSQPFVVRAADPGVVPAASSGPTGTPPAVSPSAETPSESASSGASPADNPAATGSPAAAETSTPVAGPSGDSSIASEVPAVASAAPPSPSLPAAQPAADTPTATIMWFYNTPSTVTQGTIVTITLFLSPQPDGGTETVTVDGVPLPSKTPGVFTSFQWTAASQGSFQITGSYSGTASFAPATADPMTILVIPPPPDSVVVNVSPNPVLHDLPTTITATVMPDPGAADVTFYIDGRPVGTSSLSGGVATLPVTLSAIGDHDVAAAYLGNANYSTKSSSGVTLHVVADPATLQLTGPDAPVIAGPVSVTATISPDPGGGSISWGWASYGEYNSVPVGPGGVTTIPLGSLVAGTYHLFLHFDAYGTTAAADADEWFTVYIPSSSTLTSSRAAATVGELPLVLTGTVTTTASDVPGTMTFLDAVDGDVVELGPVAVAQYTNVATFSSNALRVGTHAIRARYNGNGSTAPSTSAPVTVVVSADTAVHGTFTASRSTFYPYADGFRDTVVLGGVLDEKATVSIKLFTSSGALKRTWSLGAKAAGKFGVTWNGKTATGAKLPNGKYIVRAYLTDTHGHSKVIAVSTTVNWRQAKWITVSVTRYGDQLKYYASDSGDHLYYSPDYKRGRAMVSADIDRNCNPCVWVDGVATFTLASTALDYRSIWAAIQGHELFADADPGTAYVVNPVTLAWEGAVPLPAYLNIGYSIGAKPSEVSAKHQVTFVLECSQDLGEAFDVHYLKLTYQYAVWK